jgi:transcriptional regulator with XRE-family HTH domain
MTSTTGEDRGLAPAATHRKIPSDTLAIRIMIARVSVGLTIKEAAERCGLNYGSWSNWEAGKRPLDYMDVTDAISEGLDVDPEWLRRGGPLTPAPPTQRDRSGRRGGGSLTRRYVIVPERVTPFGQVKPATRSSQAGSAPRDVRPLPRPGSSARAKPVRRAA